jgi:hypothetical protein
LTEISDCEAKRSSDDRRGGFIKNHINIAGKVIFFFTHPTIWSATSRGENELTRELVNLLIRGKRIEIRFSYIFSDIYPAIWSATI